MQKIIEYYHQLHPEETPYPLKSGNIDSSMSHSMRQNALEQLEKTDLVSCGIVVA